MKILLAIMLLLSWSSDYDFIRAMRLHSTIERTRWWNYRTDQGIQENEVAHHCAEGTRTA